RLAVLTQREGDLANRVARASSQEQHLGIEREAVQALLREKVLRRLGRVHLAATLRVADVRRNEKVNDRAKDIPHHAPPTGTVDCRASHVARGDRDVRTGVERADEEVDDLDGYGEVRV